MKDRRVIISIIIAALLMTSCFVVKVDAKTFTKKGDYYTSLVTKDDKDEEYDSYAKKLIIKSNKFTTYGTMHYKKVGDVYSTKIYKKAKRTFRFAKKCKFYNGEKRISRKRLKKLALPLTKGCYDPKGRHLQWKIRKGKVVLLRYYTVE